MSLTPSGGSQAAKAIACRHAYGCVELLETGAMTG